MTQSHFKERIRTAGVVLILLATLTTVHAQQTVFNVPTTDVLEKGKAYFELDISAKPNDSPALKRFSSFVPRIVVGVGNRVEAGLNITGNIQPGPDSTTLVPTFKWKTYDGGDNGWAIAFGNHVFIPIQNKSYDVGSQSYVMVQKQLRSKTRIGFVGSVFTRNVVAPKATRGAGQFTVEHPITSRLSLSSDWYTGKHANGYWTSGGSYRLAKQVAVYGAYSLGNAGVSNGNHFLYFEFGYNFN